MSMRFEKYFQPKSVEECCALLGEYGKNARLLAGGTDVVPRIKMKLWQPSAVIGLMDIPGLDAIAVSETGLTLGARANLRELSLSPALAEDYQVVREACGHVSSMQVRNMATIGGNACNASPSADAIHGLLLHDAAVVIAGADGAREMPLCDFFKGPGKTDLGETEMVVRFQIKKPAAHTGAAYKKFAIRGDSDISIVGAGARLTLAEDGTIADARVTLASVAPTPLRCREAEALLTGRQPDEALFAKAAEECAAHVSPISDQRATREYRVQMVRVWVRHALQEACERAKAR